VTSSYSPDHRTEERTNEPSQQMSPPGVIAGAVLRSARRSAGLSPAQLTAAADVSEATVLSWDSGSSPIASVPLLQVERIEGELLAAGADHRLVADLAVAAWCDLVIQAVAGSEDISCLLADPLAREEAFGELLAWSIADQRPARYQAFANPGRLLPTAGLTLITAVVQVLDTIGPKPRPAM